MTRVLVIDDHPIFRRGLALSLAEAEDLTVCGEGASGAEALELAETLSPDVLLLDLSMPDGGLTVLPQLRQRHPGMAIAILTASEDSEDVMAALAAGALGYIVKGIGSRSLIEAVRGLAQGEGYVTPALAARLLTERRNDATPADADGSRGRLTGQLTPREAEILEMVASGHSNKEVARRTELKEKTVKHHMTRILHKLNARNRTEAALILRSDRSDG